MTTLLRLASALVRAWTRLYTSGLPPELREARRAEVESDLWESQHDPGRADSGFQVFARLLAGAADDLGWRFEQEHIMAGRFKLPASIALVLVSLVLIWIVVAARLSPRASQPHVLPPTLHAGPFGPPGPPPPPPPPPQPALRGDGIRNRPVTYAETSFVSAAAPAPVKIRDVRPVYPPIAIAYDLRGTVILDTTIDEHGHVVDTRVVRSIPVLDQSAVGAVRQWEFEPTAAGMSMRVIRVTVVYGSTSPRDKSSTR